MAGGTRSTKARATSSSRPRIIGAVAIIAILVVGVVGAVALATGDDDDGGGGGGAAADGSGTSIAPGESAEPITQALTGAVLADPGEVLPISDPPAAYRVTYRVETQSGAVSLARTEDISVRRPFDAQLLAYAEDGSGTSPDVDVRSKLGLYADVTNPERPDIGQGLPAAALADLRFDGVLDDLVGAGVFEVRERRQVLGRECQVYRTGGLVEAPPLAMPSSTTYADVCIDAAGVVLEEIAYVNGIAETYQIATALEIEPAFDDGRFDVEGDPLTLDEGGNALLEIDKAVAPVDGYWLAPTAPLEATHVGRYTLRTPKSGDPGDAGAPTTAGPVDPSSRYVDTYVDVYVIGASFVVIHQGVASAATSRDTTLGTDVDAGALGAARVAFGSAGSTLVASDDGWFVEVTAPLSAADLAAIAASLVRVDDAG